MRTSGYEVSILLILLLILSVASVWFMLESDRRIGKLERHLIVREDVIDKVYIIDSGIKTLRRQNVRIQNLLKKRQNEHNSRR